MPKPIKYTVHGKTAYRFRLTNPITRRRSKLSLGVVAASYANKAGDHIDTLLEAHKYQTDFPPSLIDWLARLPDEIYNKLVAAGLVGERTPTESQLLGEFLDRYHQLRASSGQWKPSTAAKRMQAIKDLKQYFGPLTPIDTITKDNALEYLQWLTTAAPEGRGLAPANASKRMKDAKQFFEHAHDEGWIRRNPFRKISLPRQDNPERLHYVDLNTIERVLQEIKDPEFRLVIALARHAGFRTPSEAKRLRWCDVNFSKKWMRVRSEKKDGDACAGHRPCPLFDPLLPYFEALPDETRAPNALVLPSLNGGGMKNLRTEFARAIERAGVPQWPRIFQNLRASALTDLAEEAPLADVCKWLGNSTPTAERHYFMVKGVELSEVKEPG